MWKTDSNGEYAYCLVLDFYWTYSSRYNWRLLVTGEISVAENDK